MPRIPRMVLTDPGQRTVYHIISRTALAGLPFEDAEKDELVHVIQRYSQVYAVKVLGYAIMGSHFHLLAEMQPESSLSDDEVRRRFHLLYPKANIRDYYPDDKLDDFRRRLCSLSDYVKDIKQIFSRYYNRRHDRKGTLWSERFKSVIVQNGSAAMHCLAYIDLNAVRAGIVKRPEAYRWCSMGYHIQTDNKDEFLCCDFGLAEYEGDEKGRLKKYRAYLYHCGAIEKPGKARISKEVLADAEKEGFQVSQTVRFRYRTRYFTDSGVIGSRDFVAGVFAHFKEPFGWQRDRIPEQVEGIDGMFSLKRLTGS